MAKEISKIFIIDRDPSVANLLGGICSGQGVEVKTSGGGSAAVKAFNRFKPDAMLLDISCPPSGAVDFLSHLSPIAKSHCQMVVMSSRASDRDLRQCREVGINVFLRKPFKSPEEARLGVARCLELSEGSRPPLVTPPASSLITAETQQRIGRPFIGSTPAMNEALELIKIAASHPTVNVLVLGESGTGKEIVARLIHSLGGGWRNPFITSNCSAIPENLMESEFFGHLKGSFTGAFDDRVGSFEAAKNGTLFLDEIGDMPLLLQAKLLRAVEEREIKRIGGHEAVKVACRIIAATNRSREDMFDRNIFRFDLLNRLNTFEIHLPPLRERPEDIPILFEFFIADAVAWSAVEAPKVGIGAMRALMEYDFPGNVRELKNIADRAVLVKPKNMESYLRREIDLRRQAEGKRSPFPILKGILNLDSNEEALIKAALIRSRGNNTKAAELLGISRTALLRRFEKFNIKSDRRTTE